MRIVRARHPLEGRSLELVGWMRRRGSLELVLVLPEGSRSLVPAGWTDLEAPARLAGAGTLASLEELVRARRLVDGLLAERRREAPR
ncbi:MAG: Y4bD/Y4pK family protein [Actinobacteria bacterium]|nr:Y4bD/Y4pK family protein [Actinomycetota bacterium]